MTQPVAKAPAERVPGFGGNGLPRPHVFTINDARGTRLCYAQDVSAAVREFSVWGVGGNKLKVGPLEHGAQVDVDRRTVKHAATCWCLAAQPEQEQAHESAV